jgi:hypothetical protein
MRDEKKTVHLASFISPPFSAVGNLILIGEDSTRRRLGNGEQLAAEGGKKGKTGNRVIRHWSLVICK